MAFVAQLGKAPGYYFGNGGGYPAGWERYKCNAPVVTTTAVPEPVWKERDGTLELTHPETIKEACGPMIVGVPGILRATDIVPERTPKPTAEVGLLFNKPPANVHTDIFFWLTFSQIQTQPHKLNLMEGNFGSVTFRYVADIPGDFRAAGNLNLHLETRGREIWVAAWGGAQSEPEPVKAWTHTKDFIEGIFGFCAQGNAESHTRFKVLATDRGKPGLCRMI
jgi:hypothetical protein